MDVSTNILLYANCCLCLVQSFASVSIIINRFPAYYKAIVQSQRLSLYQTNGLEQDGSN